MQAGEDSTDTQALQLTSQVSLNPPEYYRLSPSLPFLSYSLQANRSLPATSLVWSARAQKGERLTAIDTVGAELALDLQRLLRVHCVRVGVADEKQVPISSSSDSSPAHVSRVPNDAMSTDHRIPKLSPPARTASDSATDLRPSPEAALAKRTLYMLLRSGSTDSSMVSLSPIALLVS